MLLAGFLIGGFLIALLIGFSKSESPDLLKFNEATNKFAWNLYKEIKHSPGNVVVSPIALHLLLATLLQGANSTTANEIASVLQHKAGDENILNAFKHLLEVHHHKNKMSLLKIASYLALDETLPLMKDFEQQVSEYFKSEVVRLNFKENPEDCRQGINSMVHNYTEGEVKNLLPEGSVDSNTEMVMISGIVFKGVWKKKFDKRNTKMESFYINPNVTVNVKMMGITGNRFRYQWNSKLGAQIVELPYTEEEFRMVIILPDKPDLTELETKLSYEIIFEFIKSLRDTNVDIFLPRFKIKKFTRLSNILKKMGMQTAFSKNADFSKMTNSSISVTTAVQKAMIVVNERGSRAIAGSGLVISAKTLPPQMVCNSPFFYLILKGDTILFIGRFLKP